MEKVSQIFDPRRFGLCFKREMTLKWKAWVLRALVMLGVTTLTLTALTWPIEISPMYTYRYEQIQMQAVNLSFWLCAAIFLPLGASLFMEGMSGTGERLNYLMSPTSTAEKYWCRFAICIVAVTVAYLAVFELAGAVRLLIISHTPPVPAGLRYVGVGDALAHSDNLWALIPSLAALQATYVLGSTVWTRSPFVKTTGIIFAFNFVTMLTACLIVTHYMNACVTEGYLWMPTDDAEELFKLLYKTLPWVWAVFCYTTAYFRMRENEIINRL